MSLAPAIDRHRQSLLRIIGTVFAMLGLDDGVPVETVAKPLYRAALQLLRPAESAVRRLIVVLAHGLVVKPPKPRATIAKPIGRALPKSRQPRITFQLFDPLQRITAEYRRRRHPLPREASRPLPRIRIIDATFDPRVPLFRMAASAAPQPAQQTGEQQGGQVNARHLRRRLLAIKSALENLPRQAQRYARWQARPADHRRPARTSALRPGRPPGYSKTAIHKVHGILMDCDWLARHPQQPDTS